MAEFSIERGYELAAFQRPGVVIVMGPEAAKERLITPVKYSEWKSLPGPKSWLGYDLGFEPSLWSAVFASAAFIISGQPITDTEWRWLQRAEVGLKEAHAWLAKKADGRVGKKAAGRLLDGREWNEMPGVPNE